MKYQVVRNEYGKTIALMQCDFEDKNQFGLIAQNMQCRILCDRKDVTKNYQNGVWENGNNNKQ